VFNLAGTMIYPQRIYASCRHHPAGEVKVTIIPQGPSVLTVMTRTSSCKKTAPRNAIPAQPGARAALMLTPPPNFRRLGGRSGRHVLKRL
jgi:hypothetical protein